MLDVKFYKGLNDWLDVKFYQKDECLDESFTKGLK